MPLTLTLTPATTSVIPCCFQCLVGKCAPIRGGDSHVDVSDQGLAYDRKIKTNINLNCSLSLTDDNPNVTVTLAPAVTVNR